MLFNQMIAQRIPIVGSCLLALIFATLGLAGPAFAASGPYRSYQAGAFHHSFYGFHPNPLCSGTGCNGSNPYTTLCAGQWWDSWGVLMTTPIKDNNNRVGGYIQLWWSDTCQTNWTRLVAQQNPPATRIDVFVYPPGGKGVGGLFCLANTCTSAVGWQLYLPTTPACSIGTTSSEWSNDLYSGKVGQSASC